MMGLFTYLEHLTIMLHTKESAELEELFLSVKCLSSSNQITEMVFFDQAKLWNLYDYNYELYNLMDAPIVLKNSQYS